MKSRFIWMVLILFLYSVGANASGKGRFLSWGIDAIRNIEKTSQEDSDEVKTLKLKPIVQAIDLLDQTIEIKDDISNLLVEQDLFYMEIYEVFQGDFKKAADFYCRKHPANDEPEELSAPPTPRLIRRELLIVHCS